MYLCNEMAELPLAFTERTRQLMGTERFERYLQSFEEEPPVSIRLNPMKTEDMTVVEGEPVPWCRHAFYLPRRPNFTADPLLHAGCYYVQEAASMFLDHVISEEFTLHSSLTALDLCAAPGGKSTLLRAALPKGSVLYSSEPVRQRANILAENVEKWGYPDHIVTNAYPRDYRKSKMQFDLILCDVPCSGEGMFRKDAATIHEWSPQQVEKCATLQRDIVSDAWACLRDGGLLIYSTCTFNTKENEENIRWLLAEFDDARALSVNVEAGWNITGSLLDGFSEPVYRFIPGITRSEGLFLCVLRKSGNRHASDSHLHNVRQPSARCSTASKTMLKAVGHHEDGRRAQCPTPLRAELTYTEAMQYLRHEALVLPPDVPRGLVEVCFQGHPLGLVKNIGNRANNLYPKEWRIKTTHIPNDYEAILRHT